MATCTQARFLYGVVDADREPVRAPGLDDAAVELVTCGDVGALASPTHDAEVLPRRAALLSHTRVLDEAIRFGPVLPARFGTVLPNVDTLRDGLLAARHDVLRDDLARLRDAVEVRLRGEYDEPAALARIVRGDREVARLREQASTHRDRIRLGELVTAHLRALADREAERVVQAVRPLARDLSVQDPASALELPRLSFLVARAALETIEETVKRLDGELGETLQLHLTGPLAPHSFVDVRR